MTNPVAAFQSISPNDLDRLLTSVNQLPGAPDRSSDRFALAELFKNEHQNWADLFTERHCAPGEVVFKEDEPGDSMYVILAGQVAVVKGEFPSVVILGCRFEGETIGEMTLLEGERRSASVIALQPLQLLQINRENFYTLLGKSFAFSQGIMRLLSARLRESSDAIQRETMDKNIDALTGLFNRRYMEYALQQELIRAVRSEYPVSVIMMDIDHFKALNDTYGHQAGDQVLQNLGGLLQSQIRRTDIACRYGGEEFLVILPNVPLETAHRRAEELRIAFEALRTDHSGRILHATLSLGVAVFPEHASAAEPLIKAADQALYVAKNSGRNRVMKADVHKL